MPANSTGRMKTKNCNTCLYGLTHEECEGCLGSPSPGEDFEYSNWEKGDARRHRYMMQLKGDRNIVVGNVGELEVNAEWSRSKTLDYWRKVSEVCGYGVIFEPNRNTIAVLKTRHPPINLGDEVRGYFLFHAVFEDDRLHRIEVKHPKTEETICVDWSRNFEKEW